MKKMIIGAFLALISVSAFASPNTSTVSVSANSNATSTQGSNSLNSGNNTLITTPADTTANVTYDGTQTLNNVPSVSGPPLTTSNDTCMGSTSGSINIAGLGLGGGSTWTDTNCKRLKNAREFWNMGFKDTSLALICMDDEDKAALELTGYKCPSTDKSAAK